MNFVAFQKDDPILSKFKDLEKLYTLQKACPVNDVHDLFATE